MTWQNGEENGSFEGITCVIAKEKKKNKFQEWNYSGRFCIYENERGDSKYGGKC